MRFAGVGICRILSILFSCTFAALAAPGDVDLSFNAETGVSGWVYATTLLADGKVLISGDFTAVQTAPRSGIARLNVNGSLDPSFNPSQLTNIVILSCVVQPDGKIVAGGHDPGFNAWIRRLDPNGTIDPTFTPPTFEGRVTKLV